MGAEWGKCVIIPYWAAGERQGVNSPGSINSRLSGGAAIQFTYGYPYAAWGRDEGVARGLSLCLSGMQKKGAETLPQRSELQLTPAPTA